MLGLKLIHVSKRAPVVSLRHNVMVWHRAGDKPLPEKTRWVDGTPTSEVTPVTILYIFTPDLWITLDWDIANSKFVCSWKFKVKVMAKVKPHGHIWGREFNRYVCFLFRGNRTIFGWDIANSVFDLENSRSRSWSRSNPMVVLEAQGSIDMFAFRFVAIRPFLAKI